MSEQTQTYKRSCFIDWPTMDEACAGIAALDKRTEVPTFFVAGITKFTPPDGDEVSVYFVLEDTDTCTKEGLAREEAFIKAAAALNGEYTGS